MPWRAAVPVPTMIAAGVARPSAHGHAITSTDTAWIRPSPQAPVARPQPSQVTAATASTAGTNTALTRSTRRWIGALCACADSTSRTMRASVDSAPSALARTRSRPSALTAPPVTWSPGCLATGRLSPVISDSSTWLVPSMISPSAGTRSPGRTTRVSPTCSRAVGSSTSAPSRSTRAVSGRSACSARIASVVCRLARASSHLPNNTSVITTAADSKYSGTMAPGSARSSRNTLRPQAALVPSATSRSMLPLPARSAFQPAT
ncbi:MAG: hypothetical protein LKCHEGNO_02925 [Burkholderiaceae bacterium]|nr:hypothetical protein [Burkholderiaceae bacterium]